MEGGASGFMHSSMSLVDGCVFAREVRHRLCVKPGVKVLEWEEGESEREKT